MNDPINVLSYYEVNEKLEKRLKTIYPQIRIYHVPTLEDMIPHIGNAHIIVHWRFSDELLAKAQNLKWYQSVSAGVDHLLTPDFVNSKVILTGASGIHGIPVSEHAFALLLSLTRHIYRTFGETNITKNWVREKADELYGKTVGLLGCGVIGMEIARKAKAFGMHVRVCKRNPIFAPYIDELYNTDQMDEFFSDLDVCFLTMGITKKTSGIIDRRYISLMKKGSYLINVARGGLIVEEDLLIALKEGHLAGAGLDVFGEEPIPADHEFFKVENIVMTPHSGALSPQFSERALMVFTSNFEKWIRIQKGDTVPLMNFIQKDLAV